MNIKYFSIILFIIVVIFSISAVSAANETVTDDVNGISDSYVDSINPSNSNGSFNLMPPSNNTNNNSGVCPNNTYANSSGVSYANSSASYSSDFPILEVSVKTDENKVMHNFVDLSLKFENYSFDVNNKNYFFSLNQSFKNSSDNPVYDDKIILNVITSIKNNNLFLNVNFFNLSNQTMELYSSENLLDNLLNMLISFFNSLFK